MSPSCDSHARPVKTVRLAGAVAEMNHRRVSEGLAARAAFLLVRFVLVVPIAVVVVDFHALATVRAFRVSAHASSVRLPANPALKWYCAKERRPLAMR